MTARKTLFFDRPTCSICGSWSLATKRTESADLNGDGVIERKVDCRACGARFILVLTPNAGKISPDSGDLKRLDAKLRR